MTACSAKSFEELVYGHSYESELGELRKLVSDYKPKESKRKDRGGAGRATSAATAGKKRDKASDELMVSAMSPVARQSSAAAVSSRSLLMPLYSSYPAATTPVSASRYETAYGSSSASLPPRRKSLDANMQYGPQVGSRGHVSHHTHSHSSTFLSPSPSSFYASQSAAPCSYHDGDSNSNNYSSSSSLTPSHSGMRHRPNFASAAAAAAAAADSVVAYVAATPTSAVMNGGWSGGLHSPKATQREPSASAFSFVTFPAVAAAATSSAATSSSTIASSSSSPSASSSLLAQPSSSPPASRPSLLHSPSQSSSLALATTLAPVTLASIKTSPPQSSSKLATTAALLTSLPPPTLSSSSSLLSSTVLPRPGSYASSDPPSRASSRSNTPQPASPALAPPRPTILIPNSPLTTDAIDDGGINVTGGSDIVKGSGEAEHDEHEEDEANRRVQQEKADKKKRKKERREERRGSDKAKQQQHEDTEKSEADKGPTELSDRAARGVMSWRRQIDADKEEKKESAADETKPGLRAAVLGPDMAGVQSAASFSAVPPPTAAERVLPFADVTPPPTIDFPPYTASIAAVATPLTSLLKRVGASCALFTLVRLYVSYVSPAATSIDHNTALILFITTVLAAFFLLSPSLSSLSLKPTVAAAPSSSSLSSELSRYVQTWDMIAMDDPHQLLAAYSMTQQMLLSTLHALQPVSSSASSSPSPSMSPVSLVSHAQSILSFLDVAHQHLYSDSGYTPQLDRLLSAATAVRHHIQQISSSISPRSGARSAVSSVSSSAVLLQLVSGCCLVAYVVLPCPVWRWSPTSMVVHLLLPAAMVALETLGLFVVLDCEQRLNSGVGMGGGEVEGLLELKQRMDKRMEALIAHTNHSI